MSNAFHQSNGRFAPGNPGGPGNPYVRSLSAYRRALASAVGREEAMRVAREIYELALAGDVAAAQAILEATNGKPSSARRRARAIANPPVGRVFDPAEGGRLGTTAIDPSPSAGSQTRLTGGFASPVAAGRVGNPSHKPFDLGRDGCAQRDQVPARDTVPLTPTLSPGVPRERERIEPFDQGCVGAGRVGAPSHKPFDAVRDCGAALFDAGRVGGPQSLSHVEQVCDLADRPFAAALDGRRLESAAASDRLPRYVTGEPARLPRLLTAAPP